MSSNLGQMAQIVDRLLAKTQQSQVSWSRSSQRGLYQARFADYLVQIGGARSGVTQNVLSAVAGVTFKVSTLNGGLIDEINSGPFANALASPPVSDVLKSKLQQLYDLVADESDELNNLLRAIG
jgi:hypothetical protein